MAAAGGTAMVAGRCAVGKAGKWQGSGSGGWEHRACAGTLGPAGTQGRLAGVQSLGTGSVWLHHMRLTHSVGEHYEMEPAAQLRLSLSFPPHPP